MSALAGLVEQGLMAPDWAAALAPVDDRIGRMGQFLRDELAAGRPYLPAGENVFRAFHRPLADVRVLIVGQDPYPTPGHPIGLSFAVEQHVWPLLGSAKVKPVVNHTLPLAQASEAHRLLEAGDVVGKIVLIAG